MEHILFFENRMGCFCAGCGISSAFRDQEECSLLHLKDEIRDLYHWQTRPEATNFSSLLYTLIQKADAENHAKLAKGFPKHVAALTLWARADENEIFYKLGLMNRTEEERDGDEHGQHCGLGAC